MKLARIGLGLVAHSGCPLVFPRLARRIGMLAFARTYNKRSKLRSQLMPMLRTKPGENKACQHIKEAKQMRAQSLHDLQSKQAS